MWKAIFVLLLSWPCLGHAELVPDTTFGNAGTVDIPLNGTMYTNPARIAVLPDRRILVARLDTRPDEAPILPILSLARLSAGGNPDPSYGDGGISTFPFTSTTVVRAFAPTLVAQPDGSAYVIALLERTADAFVETDLAVLRVSADGRPDTAFNGGQPLRLRADPYVRFQHVLQPDGGLMIFGFAYTPSIVGAWRVRANGTPDPAFGAAGALEISLPEAVMSDVMPVPGGGFQILHATPDYTRNFWRRYRADGSLDTAFGTAGDAAIPTGGTRPLRYVHALGDGTFLGAETPSCGRHLFDAEGRVLSTFEGTCPSAYALAPDNAGAEAYRGGILMNGLQITRSILSPSDGTYLWLLDRQGRPDTDFPAPQSLRWRPPPGVVAGSYDVAADGDRGVVVALADQGYVPNAVRVQRFSDVRRGTPQAQAVPALGLPALLLMLAGVAMLARRRAA